VPLSTSGRHASRRRPPLGADLPGGDGSAGTAFTPNGNQLVVDFTDGAAVRWPTSVAAWEQHACAVVGRNFTREEWSRFVGSRPYAAVGFAPSR
jgi:hypothetical protein